MACCVADCIRLTDSSPTQLSVLLVIPLMSTVVASQFNGTLTGHNGLTYGFGSQSAYHTELDFSVSWVNNIENWIGPSGPQGVPNQLYATVVGVVERYRSR